MSRMTMQDSSPLSGSSVADITHTLVTEWNQPRALGLERGECPVQIGSEEGHQGKAVRRR